MKSFTKKTAAAVLVVILVIGSMVYPDTKVSAQSYYVTSSPGRIRSSVLIIGDSRIVGLAEEINSRAAFSATIGAHWHTGYKTLDTRISIGAKRSRQKTLVKAILQKYGQCHVVLSATINDVENPDQNSSYGTRWLEKSFFGMTSTMNLLSKVNVTYKGRKVKPRFYIMGIVQDRGYHNPAIVKANRKMALASNQKKYGYKYLSGIGYESEDNTYISDGCHFTTENCRRVFNAIMDGIGRPHLKV